jgi:hypothetical protein
VSLIGFKTDLSKVWKPRGLLPRVSVKGLKTDLEYENLGISERETEKEHLKYNEHPEKKHKINPSLTIRV